MPAFRDENKNGNWFLSLLTQIGEERKSTKKRGFKTKRRLWNGKSHF